MRILHLTDTHLYGDAASRHYDRIDTTAALRAVVDRLSGLGDVDLVLHTGDASDDGTVPSYRTLLDLLEPFAAGLGASLAITMGNHDVPANYAQVAGPGDHGGPWQDRTLTLTGRGTGEPIGRLVVLDTNVPGAGYGHLDPEQLDWLRESLAEPAPGIGTVLALHHPPLRAATPLLQGLGLDGLDELAAALKGSDVRVILSGHLHHEQNGSFAGIPVHVAPGITNVVDPLATGGVEQALALSGASLVEIEIGADDSAADGVGADANLSTWSAVWPNAGDVRVGEGDASADAPVYEMGPDAVLKVLAAAGRPV
jgi:3',5'-cyclic AMP phosphodiesterase CpdA